MLDLIDALELQYVVSRAEVAAEEGNRTHYDQWHESLESE